MKRIVFVCVHNSNRSQMAEAFARMYGGEALEDFSAGSQPTGRVNVPAVRSMARLGYDLTAHGSKSLADLPDVPFDVAVTMGCGDACPMVRAARREEWNIRDPSSLMGNEFDAVRDEVGTQVKRLVEQLLVDDERKKP